MRTAALVALVVALAVPAVAQPVALSPEQARRYRSLELEVSVQIDRRYRVVNQGDAYDPRYRVSDASSESWRGYVGGEEVGEIAFYEHAGADETVAFLRRERRKTWAMIGLGVALVAGAAVLESFEPEPETPGEDGPYQGAQIGLVVGGAGVALGGLYLLPRKQTGAGQALSVALRFNGALGQALRERAE